MTMSCLGNIDTDTTSGGKDRALDISIVWVPEGTDTADKSNPLTDFLWDQVDSATQMPTPIMQPQPARIPVVGEPAFFTFSWVDPANRNVIAEGPYADKKTGGPFRQTTAGGFRMRAEATEIRIDPQQKDIDPIVCRPETPYRAGARPNAQPQAACSITFSRSSASAKEYATKPIPAGVDDAFHMLVEVDWSVTYGEGTTSMRALGDGFTMRLHQVLPVQEIQGTNQPPAVIW